MNSIPQKEMQELMGRVALVHISCSGDGLRIVFTADINVGNLADNQIEFAKALGGYQADRRSDDDKSDDGSRLPP